MTYKEIVFFCLDQLKIISDDSYITLEHVLFLANKIRALLLKQQYKDVKKEIPESYYLTLCLDLIQVPAISGEPCEGGTYLRSKQRIPTAMTVGNTSIYPIDYYQGNITYVSRERMRYVGNNPWLKNIIYASLGPDQYLYLKSDNPQYLYMDKALGGKGIRMTGIFEDPDKAAEYECGGEDKPCDIMDREFPIEEGLVSTLIELVVKYLSGMAYRGKDTDNNASDDLSDLMSFVRRNMKSDFLKQIEN